MRKLAICEVSTRSVASKTSMLVLELWVDCLVYYLEKYSVQDLARPWQEHDSQVVIIVFLYISFISSLIRMPSFQSSGILSFSQIFLKRLFKMLTAVSVSALIWPPLVSHPAILPSSINGGHKISALLSSPWHLFMLFKLSGWCKYGQSDFLWHGKGIYMWPCGSVY